MFSNLTSQMSQVSSWIGSKKGEVEEKEEKVPSPTTDIDGVPADGFSSPSGSKAGGKLEMLSNVKGSVSSWIGSVQVPSVPNIFSKGGEAAPADGAEPKLESPTAGESVKGEHEPHKDNEDDNSRYRATGGADSDAVPEEEEGADPGVAGGVSTKAVAGAKTIGSFLFSAVNKAGETVSKAGAKIKKTVEENTLLGEFNKEQEAFMNEKEGKATDAAVPPWVGVPNEESLKEECLSLSTDRRNFIRAPPPGVDFPFDYETSYKVAQATLAEDPNLEKMRFDLVPKAVSEENFWRNYFYRVSLLRQQAELNAMEPSRTSSVDAEPAA